MVEDWPGGGKMTALRVLCTVGIVVLVLIVLWDESRILRLEGELVQLQGQMSSIATDVSDLSLATTNNSNGIISISRAIDNPEGKP
jgi:hypothetical protein